MIEQDAELTTFLNDAAEHAGIPVPDLLRRILHVNSLVEDERFAQVFSRASNRTIALMVKLDYQLRVLNPGLHYVYRGMYLGYRREVGLNRAKASERAQIFVSVVPRGHTLLVILPIDPTPYASVPGCRDLTGQGHHGIGDLQVDLRHEQDLDDFFRRFRPWLTPSLV